jgi:hypothetical protein
MKTVWKVILIINAAIVGLFITLFVVLLFLITANNATTPDEIARKAGMRLPDYRITRSEDNTARTSSSCWTWYYYEVEFEKPLSESFLKKVGRMKTVTREGTTYRVKDENPDEWYCLVCLYPEENRAMLKYLFYDYTFPIPEEDGENP